MNDPIGPTTFSGNPLNRVSWLREDLQFLREAYAREDARFLLFNKLDPLVEQHDEKAATIARLTRSQIGKHLPEQPFQDADEKGKAVDVKVVDDEPLVVFLGVEEDEQVEGSSLPAKEAARPSAPPVFAVDLSTREKDRQAIINAAESPKRRFLGLRTQVDQLSYHDAGLTSCARSLLDWNRRTRFCAGCGKPVVPTWGGWKRSCLSEVDCPSVGRVQNFTYPRTDSVIISLLLHPTEDKILLGRQRVWPTGFFSCLAGFVEPGETLEEAVIRETWEEAGVRVRNVRYLRSQPWPFPNSLMCGLVAEAEPGSSVRTDLDNELEAAEWYDRPTILRALEKATGFSEKERNHIDKHYGDKTAAKLEEQDAPQPKIRLPPVTAIAHHLIKLWAIGEVGRVGGGQHSKM